MKSRARARTKTSVEAKRPSIVTWKSKASAQEVRLRVPVSVKSNPPRRRRSTKAQGALLCVNIPSSSLLAPPAGIPFRPFSSCAFAVQHNRQGSQRPRVASIGSVPQGHQAPSCQQQLHVHWHKHKPTSRQAGKGRGVLS